MNTARLIKQIPTLIVISFLAYSGYSVQPNLPSSIVPREHTTIAETAGTKNDVETRENGAESRDPFQFGSEPDAVAVETQNTKPASTDLGHGSVAEVIRGMKLGATFIQGRNQSAIIDGRIYRQGQHVELEAPPGEPGWRLIVANVMPTKVILQDGGQSYELTYSDQIGPRSKVVPTARPDRSQDAPTKELDSGEALGQLRSLLLNTLGLSGNGNAASGLPSGGNHAAAGQP